MHGVCGLPAGRCKGVNGRQAVVLSILLVASELASRALGHVLVVGFGSSDPIRVFTLDPAGGLSAQGSFAVDAGARHSGWLALTRDLSRVYAAVGGAVAGPLDHEAAAGRRVEVSTWRSKPTRATTRLPGSVRPVPP